MRLLYKDKKNYHKYYVRIKKNAILVNLYALNLVFCILLVTFVMRNIIRTPEFDEFYNSLDDKIQAKIDHALVVLDTIRVINTKLVKKLSGTQFYELRISAQNEYRVILLCCDNDNFINATNILFLNGFMKKSTKDYNKQIKIAESIIENLNL